MRKAATAILLILSMAVMFTAGSWYSRRPVANPGAVGDRKVLYYVDPMNPSHTSDKPGTAPCGMAMEPVYAEDGKTGVSSMSPGGVAISPRKQQLLGVQISPVENSAGTRTIRTIGRVAPDETRVHRLMAGASGFIREVSEVTSDSYVTKDQWLASFSSPDSIQSIQAFILALNTVDSMRQTNLEQSAEALEGGAIYQIRVEKMQDLGISPAQVEEIRRTRQIPRRIQMLSPIDGFVLARNISPGQKFERGMEWYRIADLSRVWIVADVFEREARYIKPGMRAKVSLPDRGKVFDATVTHVPPQFDAVTRTLKARLEVDNPEFELRPDMFVDVELLIELPETLTVPIDAVLDSGVRKTVFVDLGNGHFEPREVKTGWRFDDRVQILEGLSAGDPIVVSGNFLIDSESRMKLAAGGYFGTSVKDPVCGMEVYPSKSRADGLIIESGGKNHYFCSPECKEQFEKDPVKAVEKAVDGGLQHVSPGSQKQPAENQQAAVGFVKDPVCRMPVSETRAKAAGLEIEYGGKTYYFCSGQCKGHFIKAPERYKDKSPPGMAGHGSPEQGGHRHD